MMAAFHDVARDDADLDAADLIRPGSPALVARLCYQGGRVVRRGVGLPGRPGARWVSVRRGAWRVLVLLDDDAA